VLVAEGDYLGGFALYVMRGKPRFTYSFLGLKIDTIEGSDPLPTGPVRVRYELTADKPGVKAGGGMGRLLVNGREVDGAFLTPDCLREAVLMPTPRFAIFTIVAKPRRWASGSELTHRRCQGTTAASPSS
jgi:hypothetical protein